MRKKILYLGILLFIFGIALAFSAANAITSSQFSTPNFRNLTVNSNSTNYLALPLNQTGIVELIFESNSPVDFYFTNETAFSKISSPKLTPSGISSIAVSLEGNGVYEVYKNSTHGAFPYASYENITTPDYMFNGTPLFNESTYYAVFAYSGNASTTVQLSFTSMPLSDLKLELGKTGSWLLILGVAVVLGLAGIAISIVSVFMKPKQSGKDETDEEAKKEYDKIMKSNKSRKTKSD
jgi:hypothetical protein